jgi:hypothetical protein
VLVEEGVRGIGGWDIGVFGSWDRGITGCRGNVMVRQSEKGKVRKRSLKLAVVSGE